MAQKDSDTQTKTCPSCPTGQLEKGRTLIAFGETSQPPAPVPTPVVVVTGIPAEVCDVCGEAILDSETTRRVNELVKDVRYLWNRFPDRLSAEGVVVGGTPGKDGGIVRIDFGKAELSANRISVRGEGSEEI